jgi:IS1 family transposase
MLRIASAIKKPTWSRPYCTFHIDELWTYVKRKGQFTYITYCLEEETGTVLDFSIGQRSYKTIAPMVNKLLGNHPKRIYTDRLAIYPKLIPNRVHKVFKYATNKIERNNLNLRLRIKRLARKTICFSKSEKYLRAHLMIYFWGNKPIV